MTHEWMKAEAGGVKIGLAKSRDGKAHPTLAGLTGSQFLLQSCLNASCLQPFLAFPSCLKLLMHCSDADIRQIFERHRLRCTCQRVAIYRALCSCRSHPTAEELYQMVQSDFVRLSRATVYNTLDALCRAGLCRRFGPATGANGTNGCCRYDADTDDHPHVWLDESGEVVDVPPRLAERLSKGLPRDVLREIEDRLGITIENVNIQLHGRRTGDRFEA